MARARACSPKGFEEGRLIWPSVCGESVTILPARLSYLLSGIDSRPRRCTPGVRRGCEPRRWLPEAVVTRALPELSDNEALIGISGCESRRSNANCTGNAPSARHGCSSSWSSKSLLLPRSRMSGEDAERPSLNAQVAGTQAMAERHRTQARRH